MSKVVTDPLQVKERLWKQVSELIKDMEVGDNHDLAQRIRKQLDDKRAKPETLAARIEEELGEEPRITMAERIRAMAAIGRIVYAFNAMQLKAASDEPEHTGSAVRKYAKSFAANGARGRKAPARPAKPSAPAAFDLDPFADDPDDEHDAA